MEQSTHPLVGQQLPPLEVTDWSQGPPDIEGAIVVIDFWATWCMPCIGAIPKNNAMAKEYAGQGVVVMGICGTTGSDTMAEVVEEQNISYPTARDVAKATEKALKVPFFPCYFLVDRKGVVRQAGLSHSQVEPALRMLLEEQPPAEA